MSTAHPATLVNERCELRFDGSRGWQVRTPGAPGSPSAAPVGEICGLLCQSLPKVYGSGGRYRWPLHADQMIPDTSAPTTVHVKGVGNCQTRTFSGSIVTSTPPPPLGDQSAKPTSGASEPASISIQFALPDADSASPLCLWRVSARGLEPGVRLDYIELMRGAMQVGGSPDRRVANQLVAQRRVYVNGWQSWTFSGTLKCTEKQPYAWPHTLNSAFHNKVTGGAIEKAQARGSKYRNDMFTCVSEHPQWAHTDTAKVEKVSRTFAARSGILLGWLSQRENFGVVRLDETGGAQLITMVAECDGQVIGAAAVDGAADGDMSFRTDWAVAHMMHSSSGGVGIETYVDAVGAHLDARVPSSGGRTAAGTGHRGTAAAATTTQAPVTTDQVVCVEKMANEDDAPGSGARARFANTGGVPVGWCSWYHFYEKISEEKLLRNCQVLCQLRDADHSAAKLGDASAAASTPAAKNAGTLPTNLFLVDDGYTPPKHWGDWTNQGVDSKRFPRGMKAIADHVRESGLVPGLWMTPFSADKSSALFKAHPDWILRKAPGRGGCNSGFPGKFFYGMDATNPEVLAHVTQSIRRAVDEWGFPFIKLDFLYACILRDHTGKRPANNRMDASTTRAQAFGQALRVIREAAGPDTFILGCGCPVGPAVGWADAMRVSADAGPTWYPVKPFGKDKNNLPCGRNMVRNSLARISFHNRWWLNDPDCLILRNDTKLTTDEVVGIASCAAVTGGLLLVSDDLKAVGASRMRIAEVVVPPTGRPATAHDVLLRETPEVFTLDLGSDDRESSELCSTLSSSSSAEVPEWRVLALGNWRQDTAKAHLVSGALLGLEASADGGQGVDVFEFWSSTYRRVMAMDLAQEDEPLWQSLPIPAHSCHLYALRQVRSGDDAHCAYVGSNMHFTCGRELVGWEDGTVGAEKTRTLKLQVALPRVDAGAFVWLRLPCAADATPRVVRDGAPDASPVLVYNGGSGAMWSVWKVGVDVTSPVAGTAMHSGALEVHF